MNIFGAASALKLSMVHPDLQSVFKEAISDAPYDFSITCGIRTKEEQKKLFDAGKSKTMNSRHLTGNAVDVCVIIDGKASWEMKHYKELMEHVKTVAKTLNVPIQCGCDWESFPDGPHVELDRKHYP